MAAFVVQPLACLGVGVDAVWHQFVRHIDEAPFPVG